MGYLHELHEELRAMLGDVDEAKQKEIAHWVGEKVLESYRNGQANGAATSRLANAEKGLEAAGKRLFQKRKRA